jgi:hypothetical protein
LLLGWGWWALASAVIALPLPADYLLHGPRLLYLGSVGLALVWPVLLGIGESPFEDEPMLLGRWQLVVPLVVLIICTANWQFVSGRLADYTRLTNPIIVVQKTAMAPDAGIVLVNLPQWLAPARTTYPIGAEFTAILGNYLFAGELISANRPDETAVFPLIVPDLLSHTPYIYGLHDESRFSKYGLGQRPLPTAWWPHGSEVFITRYLDAGPATIHTGALQPQQDGLPLAHFASYDLLANTAAFCHDKMTAELIWTAVNDIPDSISIFVQAFSADGRLLAQADGPPLGLPPTSLLHAPGWQMKDLRQLPIASGEQPTHLLIGVYDFMTGQRQPLITADPTAVFGDAFAIPVMPCFAP